MISGQARRSGGCLVLTGGRVVVSARAGTYRLPADPQLPLTVALRRFATSFDVDDGIVPAGRTATVRIPADRAPEVPWQMLVSGHGRLCA